MSDYKTTTDGSIEWPELTAEEIERLKAHKREYAKRGTPAGDGDE